MKRTSILAAAILPMIAAIGVSAAGPQSDPTVTERGFVSGGRIDIWLESGDYDIQAAAGDRIRVKWSTRYHDPKVTLNTNGNHADLTIEDTPNHDFHATIEIPARSDVRVRLTAGDLRMSGITGHKDIGCRAGDVSIHVGDPNDYAKVEASVTAGDLNAPAFNVNKGGLFRSFSWTGPGKYNLQVHMLAGDLTLTK